MSVEAPTPDEIETLRTDARGGDMDAQNALGVYLNVGLGVPQDSKEAVAWLTKAAKAGHPQSARELGLCYAHGCGVPQDHEAATKWLGQSANERFVEAMTPLAGVLIVQAEESGDEDLLVEAAKWLMIAGWFGDLSATRYLLSAHEHVVAQGYEDALEQIERAHEQAREFILSPRGNVH